MVAASRTRFYREFLTPALHRRFTRAASLLLLVCYVEAFLIGDLSSFLWSWFPLGRTGIRTLLLFISGLSIFILRVAQLHFGTRNAISPFGAFQTYLVSWNTVRTPIFYVFSAWWFSEIYKWSASTGANLGIVADGKPYERQRLNERPIYLATLSLVLAVSQSFIHLYEDYDRVATPLSSLPLEVSGEQPLILLPPIDRLKDSLPSTLYKAFSRALAISLATPLIYMFIRGWAWHSTLLVARLFWNIPKASEPSRLPPFHYTLLWRSLVFSVLLVCLWELANSVFDAFVAQEPLKHDNPLTSESLDPNGSLLNGLKSRKETVKVFAFWELLYISQRFEDRRKKIFSDIDRAGGPAWTQIVNTSLATIQNIGLRIAEYNSVSAPAPKESVVVENLPRLLSPLEDQQILTALPPSSSRAKKLWDDVWSSNYSSPTRSSPSNTLSPRTKQYLIAARNKVLTPAQQKALSPQEISSSVNDLSTQFLQSAVGYPFRQTFSRRVYKVLFSSPSSDLCIIIYAVDAITSLALASLEEDQYGTVSKDIPQIARVFADTIKGIDGFLQALPLHWTDVESKGTGNGKQSKECDMVIAHLKVGLKKLLEAFGTYAMNLGLRNGEMRELRLIAGLDA